MRVLSALLTVGLAACSGLPPQPVVPLRAGELAGGLTLDVPVYGPARGGLSLWAGVGAGAGIDLAASADAPMSLIAELGAIGRGERPLLPPGVALRKSFASGASVGVGVGSQRTFLEAVPPLRGPSQITVGPFASVGSADPGGVIAGRASAHLVYEVRVRRADTASVRRGWALYGVGVAGPVVRSDSGFVVPGVRATAGAWLGTPAQPSLTIGTAIEGVGTPGRLDAR